jgi:ABC-type dipeptide/oligopeptide/nickel transport system permease subunit
LDNKKTMICEANQRSVYMIKFINLLKNSVEILKKIKQNPIALIGGVLVFTAVIVSFIDPYIVPHDPMKANLYSILLPPFWMEGGDFTHILGTDRLGMDIFSRIIAGTRISFSVGFITVIISIAIGGILGLASGYFGGYIDSIISRFADLLLGFPYLIFALAVMAVLGPGFINLIIALSFKGWVGFFRVVRGEVYSQKTMEYVEAAKALGQSKGNIIFKEILPNVINSVLVLGTLRMGFFIIMEASLSFLGLGIPYPEPAWGSMVNVGRMVMLDAWWVATFPGIAILILVLSINLFGEGLRDIFDPRLREVE